MSNANNPFEEAIQKYKDPDGIANALTHKDEHISKIELENSQLREALTAQSTKQKDDTTMSETLDALSVLSTTQHPSANHASTLDNEETPVTTTEQTIEDDITQTQEESVDDKVNRLVEERMNALSSQSVAETNYAKANELLVSKYGDAAGKAIQETLAKTKLDADSLKGIAERSPEGLLSLVVGSLGAEGPNTSAPVTTQSRLNSEAVTQTNEVLNASNKSGYAADMEAWKNASSDEERAKINDKMLEKTIEQGAEAYGIKEISI